jgi:hypothetical protein
MAEAGFNTSMIVYTAVANALTVLPVMLYLFIDDVNGYAAYHQTYINMLTATYAPMSVAAWIVNYDDSKKARESLTAATEMAGLGPFSLMWVGYYDFLMKT